jgi:lysozyme
MPTTTDELGKQVGESAKKITDMNTLQANDLVIDVSHHNGVIDWFKVKNDAQGIKGAIIKATEGGTGLSKKFLSNARGASEVGLLWSAYHFSTWNNEDELMDATNEAKFFLSAINLAGIKPTLPLVLDIESNEAIPYTKAEMVTFVSAFRKVINDAGYELAIYASPGFLNSYLPTNHPFTDCRLWVADYTGNINPVPGWKSYWLHQYTEKGKVSGISTTTDMNRVITP